MNILLAWNSKLVSLISQHIRGAFGIVAHVIILAVIFGIIGVFADWAIHILLTSLVWLIPIIITVIFLILLIYLVLKSSSDFN